MNKICSCCWKTSWKNNSLEIPQKFSKFWKKFSVWVKVPFFWSCRDQFRNFWASSTISMQDEQTNAHSTNSRNLTLDSKILTFDPENRNYPIRNLTFVFSLVPIVRPFTVETEVLLLNFWIFPSKLWTFDYINPYQTFDLNNYFHFRFSKFISNHNLKQSLQLPNSISSHQFQPMKLTSHSTIKLDVRPYLRFPVSLKL